MKRYFFLTVTFPTVLLLLVLTSGCSSLSRSTAENLIKARGEEILGQPIGIDVDLHLSLDGVVANDDEINRRVPLDHSPLPKGKYLPAKFVDLLEKAGVLRLVSINNHVTTSNSYLGSGHRSLILHYDCIPNEDIKKLDNGAYVYETAKLILVRPQLSNITGITQSDKSARVEADIKFVPTKMYTQVKKLLAQLESQEGASIEAHTGRVWFRTLRSEITQIDYRIASVEKGSFSFAKYDDGWRLDNR